MTAAQELVKFMASYEPGMVRQAKQVRAELRKNTPGALSVLLFAIENARPSLCNSQSQYEKLSAWEF